MGRIYVQFDPPGYYRLQEPGFDLHLTGDKLLAKWNPNPANQPSGPDNFLLPPGSQWLMPRPVQLNSDWYADSRLVNHVLRQANWIFSNGITPREWEPTLKPGGTGYPANKWLTLPTIPLGVEGLMDVNFAALAAAAGVSLPAGMQVVGMAPRAPIGGLFSAQPYTPFVQYASFPAPDELFVFGFADMALVLGHQSVSLVRSTDFGLQNWQRLDKRHVVGQLSDFSDPYFQQLNQGTWQSGSDVRIETNSALIVQNGPDHIYIFFRNGQAVPIRLRNSADPNDPGNLHSLIQGGLWWVAAAPNQRLTFQIQVVGYETANSAYFNLNGIKPIFSLGRYHPTGPFSLYLREGLHLRHASDLVVSTGTAGATISSASSGEQIVWQLIDELANPWVSDGLHNTGGLNVALVPSSEGGGYLAPQLAAVDLKFDPQLVARANSPLTLNDHQVKGWKCSTSWAEPGGKRLEVDLWDNALGVLSSHGFPTADSYPIHVLEDVNNDGTPETIRAAGWVESPETETLVAETQIRPDGSVLALPIQYHRIHAKGLLSRAQQPWYYLPQVTDPEGLGFIEHTAAVAKALSMSRFDVTDSSAVFISADPFHLTTIAQLPGTPARQDAQIGQKVDSPWAPDWNETRLGYIERVAKQWRGWVIYEGMSGQVLYHPNLVIDMLLGMSYYRCGTIYRRTAEALAAGVPRHQAYVADSYTTEAPEGNTVVVFGKEPDGTDIQPVIDQDLRSIGDTSYLYFMGEEKVVKLTPKLAVGQQAVSQIARLKLLTGSRRRILRTISFFLAPWQVQKSATEAGFVEAGQVITIAGKGNFLIVHLEVEQIMGDGGTGRGNLFLTEITGELVPPSAFAGLGVGYYPGFAAIPGTGG